jgi:NAD(P)-dependent dehydrogenase (short-subunit alcohol dehydrogenase family)
MKYKRAMKADASAARYALVTGGSSGIGLETARGLASHFDVVGIVGRNEERLASAAEELASSSARIEVFRADFSSLEEVRQLAGEVRSRFPLLSVLVNNAGVWHKRRTLSKDGYEETFAVNHLAHFLLTNELREPLVAGAPSRVVNVSSSMHRRVKSLNWDDLMFERGWRGFRAYSHSKLANAIFSSELARRWGRFEITSNSLNPGNVRSRITRNNAILNWLHRSFVARTFILSEEDGAKTSIYVATAPELEGVTGRYFEECAEAKANPVCHDERAGERLWKVSEKLIERAR